MLTSMDEIHGIVESKLEKVTVKLGYMGKSAQLISATKSTRRFQIENEGELDHEKADFPP